MRPILGLVCLLSAAAIGGELWYGVGGATDRAMLQRPPVQAVTKRATEHAALTEGVDQWVDVALARPLFAPDRRPVAGSRTAEAGLPRLAGVIVSPSDKVAIFQSAGVTKPVSVRHGETVNGWLVTMIEANSVSLRKAASTLVLRPEFGDLAPGHAAKKAAEPPSRWVAAAETGLLRERWSNPQLQP
jgi:hypothetical protein